MAMSITYTNIYNVLFLCVTLMNGVAGQGLGGPSYHGEFCRPGNEDCYSLYGAESSNGVTWSQAYTTCRGFKKQLAVVKDELIQQTVDQFVFSMNQQLKILGHAWIAGTRSTDPNWRDTQGNVIKVEVAESWDASRLCSRLEKNNATGLDLVAASCKGPGVKGICERQVPQGLPCGEGEVRDSWTSKCVSVTEEAFESWSQADAACYNKGARLSFTELNNTALQLPEYTLLADNNYWAALTRRPWVWRTDSKEDMLFTYSNFRPGEGMTFGEDCVHMELRDGGKWSDKNCKAASDYFICQNLPLQTADTTPVVTEVVTNATEADHQTTSSTTLLPTDLLSYRDVFILVACIGAALIIINITVAIICLRRKKKSEKDVTTEENHQIHPIPLTEVTTTEAHSPPPISPVPLVPHYDDIQHYNTSQAPSDGSNNYYRIPSLVGSNILPNHNAPTQGLNADHSTLTNHNAPTQGLYADHNASGIDQILNHNANSGIDQEDSDSGIVSRYDTEGYLAPVGGTGHINGSSIGSNSDQGSQIDIGDYLTTSTEHLDKERTSTGHGYLKLVSDEGNYEIPVDSFGKPEGSDEKPGQDNSYASLDAQTRNPPSYTYLKDVAED